MNLGKFHSILLMGQEELSANDLAVANFCAMLENIQNKPGNVEFAQKFSDSQSEFYTQLGHSFSVGFATGSKKMLDEAGIRPYLGDELRASIKRILGENSLTLALAHARMTELYSTINAKKLAVDRILEDFGKLGVAVDDQSSQECEATFLFPANFVGGRLDKFAAEVKGIDQILGNLSEIATGNRKSGYKIHSVASSDYRIDVVISMLPAALLFTKLVSEVIGIYVKLQKAKYWVQKTKAGEYFGEKVIAEMEKEYEGTKEKEVNRAVDTLVKSVPSEERAHELKKEVNRAVAPRVESGSSKGREHELKNEMRQIIKAQLHKMDNGVEIDIYPPIQLPKKKSDSSDDGKQEGKVSSEQDQKMRQEIAKTVTQIRQVEIDEKAKLGLPAPSESDPDDADSA